MGEEEGLVALQLVVMTDKGWDFEFGGLFLRASALGHAHVPTKASCSC